MRSAKKGSNSMKVRQLNKTSYPQTRRAIDDMTIEMYQDITSGLLHDNSPIQLASDIFDIWEVVAQSLYDNNNLTHREFLTCITRIGHLLEEAYKSLGVECDVE
jgi:hypothetical protein